MNRWLLSASFLPMLAACNGSSPDSSGDEAAVTSRATFRVPLVDDSGKKLSSYNAALAKKGLAPFPEYFIVDEAHGRETASFWSDRADEAAAALKADFSFPMYTSPGAMPDGFCYEGDGTKLGFLSESLSDNLFSDQFILGGWRYKAKSYDAYPEDTKDAVWTGWKGTTEDVLLTYSTDDDGTPTYATVSRCSGSEAAPSGPSAVFQTKEGTPLVLELFVRDGVKKTTLNKRYLKVVATRGQKSFEAFCDLRGNFAGDTSSRMTTIDCSLTAETVSHDDDESLSFQITETYTGKNKTPAYLLEEISYVGDGTFLGEESGILLGGEQPGTEFDLTKKTFSGEPSNPFAVSALAHDALSDLAGEAFYVKALGATTKVHSYSGFRVDEAEKATFDLRLGPTGSESAIAVGSFSLLSTEGLLSSGYATASTLTSRAKSSLPTKP